MLTTDVSDFEKDGLLDAHDSNQFPQQSVGLAEAVLYDAIRARL